MDKKKRVHETEVMALPPLRMELARAFSLEPKKRRKSSRQALGPDYKMENAVKRAIAYIRDEK